MKFDLISIVGALTVACSYGIKFIGFPNQIKKSMQNNSFASLSKPLFILSFISYILWTIYGILKNDWVIIAGQSVGILTAGILLYKMFNHKNQ
jgi:MtN3 and saliva related transmembrane protein